ncbi:MAG: ABC transporter substrate-binding protein, partial [Gaiellaceae bacterium]
MSPRTTPLHTRRRGLAAAACLTATALVLTACSDDGASGEGSDDPIVVGISLPLTGDFSEPGKGVQRGYEAWAEFVNEDGGLLGRQVELKILDDQSSADRVVQDYEALIAQDEVDLVFGPFSTRLVVPSARVAEEYGMLYVEPAGAASEVFEQDFENLFYAAPAVADDHYNYLA